MKLLLAAALTLQSITPQPSWVAPVVDKVLEMCKAPTPVEITIEQKSTKWMITEVNKNYPFNDIRRTYPKYIKGLTNVRDMSRQQLTIFVVGWDVETVVHETIHYCVYWMTDPPNLLLQQEDLTRKLTEEFLVSKPIQDLLEELNQ